MPKAIVVPTTTSITNNQATVSYTCSLILPTNISYSSEYIVNTGIGLAANVTAWKSKIIAEATTMGSPGMVATDVIIIGNPI